LLIFAESATIESNIAATATTTTIAAANATQPMVPVSKSDANEAGKAVLRAPAPSSA
jgi:hypothetical protein